MTQGSSVSILGLGSMGLALAQAMVKRGHGVTVWNRSPDKAAALVAQGAKLASSPQAALAASPLTVMCVLDYASADAILAQPGVDEAIAGRTFVQLSTGVPHEIAAQQAWVNQRGGKFVAGGIVAYPQAIGQPNCMIVYAGDKSFEDHRETLASLGGSVQYLGTEPQAVTGAYFALSSLMIGGIALFLETAAVARHYGLSIDSYYSLARLANDQVLEGIRDASHRIATGDFDGKLASIDLTIAGMQEVCDTFAQIGIPARMTQALVDQLKLASAEGQGGNDISSLVEALSKQSLKV